MPPPPRPVDRSNCGEWSSRGNTKCKAIPFLQKRTRWNKAHTLFAHAQRTAKPAWHWGEQDEWPPGDPGGSCVCEFPSSFVPFPIHMQMKPEQLLAKCSAFSLQFGRWKEQLNIYEAFLRVSDAPLLEWRDCVNECVPAHPTQNPGQGGNAHRGLCRQGTHRTNGSQGQEEKRGVRGEQDVKSVARREEIVQLNTKARTKFHLRFLELQMQLLFQSVQM